MKHALQIVITLLIVTISDVGLFAQTDSLTLEKSKDLIAQIDFEINELRDTIDYDDAKTKDKLKPDFKLYNKVSCDKLRTLISNLRLSLYNDYKQIDNINFQIEPLLSSYQKCVAALEALTSHVSIYQANDKDEYNNAYLFKELAKGNLFRVVSEKKPDKNNFEVYTVLGYMTNGMYNTLNDAYNSTVWINDNNADKEFKNENLATNIIFIVGFNYRLTRNFAAGINFQTLPSTQINGQHTYAENDSLNLTNTIAEQIRGNMAGISCSYIIKPELENGDGFSISFDAGVKVCNYNVKRSISGYERFYDHTEYIQLGDSSAILNVYNYLVNTKTREANFSSLSFSAGFTAKYFIKRNLAACLRLAQCLDTGVNINEMSLRSSQLPAYKLRYGGFCALLGIAVHF